MEDIKRFTLEDLKAYHDIYYNPVNAFLVVVGDFKKDDLLQSIKKILWSDTQRIAPGTEKRQRPASTWRAKSVSEKGSTTSFSFDGLSYT